MRFTVKQSNPDWVKELQKAAVDGAVMQWRSTSTGKWMDIEEGRDVQFTLSQSEYRIKPAPVVPIEVWFVKLGGRIYSYASSKKCAEDTANRANSRYKGSVFTVGILVEEIVDEA